MRAFHLEVVARTIAAVERLGGVIQVDAATDLLTVNEEFTVSVTITVPLNRVKAPPWKPVSFFVCQIM